MRLRTVPLLFLASFAACTDNSSGNDAGADAGFVPGPVDPTVCMTPATCPGVDTECATRTCTNGKCGLSFTAAGTRSSGQVNGDCRVRQCDGQGGINSVADNTDKPFGQPCTAAECVNGAPVYTARDAGASCGSGLTCDGRGLCVGCLTAASCPGTDTTCATRACVAGVCRFTFTAADASVPSQTPGDCRENRCDGDGGIAAMPLDSDRPNDNNPCTDDVCVQGQPRHPARTAGTSCSMTTADVCNGDGGCVQCVTASTCPGVDGECAVRSCTAGRCGFRTLDAGVVLASQTEGDCQERRCDGDGGVVSAAQDTDVRDAGGVCTRFGCNAGAPTTTFADAGTACGTGLFCDATGACQGCSQPSDCPGSDTECRVRTCSGGLCGFADLDAGVLSATQVPGDCRVRQCNGSGGVSNVPLDSDLPDAGPCRSVSCSAGLPSFNTLPMNSPCSGPDGGAVCTAGGVCVQCTMASQCLGTDDTCRVRTCSNDVCGVMNFTTTQTCGDAGVCNGMGACVDAGSLVTYATHARPIYAAKCMPCHAGGGSGGHNIALNYADSQLSSYYCPGKTKGACTLVRIQEGSMPAGANCSGNPTTDMGNPACLTAAEQATLAAWIDGGQLP